MEASSHRRIGIGATAVSWVGYSAVSLGAIYVQGDDWRVFWPILVTVVWALGGLGLAITTRHRGFGVGLVMGFVLGLLTLAAFFAIELGLLARDIGYS